MILFRSLITVDKSFELVIALDIATPSLNR